MDPTTCYQRLLDALADGDKREALAAAEDLRRWLDAGGFAPVGTPIDEVTDTIQLAHDIINDAEPDYR